MLGEETLPPADGKLAYRHTVGKRLPPGRYTVIGSIPALGGPMSANTEIEIQ